MIVRSYDTGDLRPMDSHDDCYSLAKVEGGFSTVVMRTREITRRCHRSSAITGLDLVMIQQQNLTSQRRQLIGTMVGPSIPIIPIRYSQLGAQRAQIVSDPTIWSNADAAPLSKFRSALHCPHASAYGWERKSVKIKSLPSRAIYTTYHHKSVNHEVTPRNATCSSKISRCYTNRILR